MRNIIITGGGMLNKGAQAMTLIAVHELRKRFPDHCIYLYSPVDLANKNLDKNQFAFDFISWYPLKFARCQHRLPLRLLCKLRNGKELAQCEEIYKNCDAMIDISGYALGSNWSEKVCCDFLDVLEFAQAFGIPVYLMPQSFGPFEFGAGHPGIDDRCRKLLPTCRAILAREQEGYDALVNTYGLTNVQLAPDLVLNSKGIDLTRVFKTVPEMNLPRIAPGSIAVVPNGRNLSVGNAEQALALYAAAIRCGLDQGRYVYLLHHATSDAAICRQLKEQYAEDSRVIVLEQEFSCLEFNELVKQFDYLVASRFHSIVHAYKSGVPCVTLGWAKKYEDLLSQFGQSPYLFDIRNAPDAQALASAMNQMDRCSSEESKTILSRLAAVQQHNVFDILQLYNIAYNKSTGKTFALTDRASDDKIIL